MSPYRASRYKFIEEKIESNMQKTDELGHQ
jgi:hypothetical protein